MKRVSGPRRVAERRFCVWVTQAHARDFVAPSGVHVRFVSERLGHRWVTITLDTYSYAIPGLSRTPPSR
jgi:hypothetical protein